MKFFQNKGTIQTSKCTSNYWKWRNSRVRVSFELYRKFETVAYFYSILSGKKKIVTESFFSITQLKCINHVFEFYHFESLQMSENATLLVLLSFSLEIHLQVCHGLKKSTECFYLACKNLEKVTGEELPATMWYQELQLKWLAMRRSISSAKLTWTEEREDPVFLILCLMKFVNLSSTNFQYMLTHLSLYYVCVSSFRRTASLSRLFCCLSVSGCWASILSPEQSRIRSTC